MIGEWPVLGICGSSGVGKTTLIESLIPVFVRKGLRVAVVKYDAHNVRMDAPGKDSERYFQASADVCLLAEDSFFRCHGREDATMVFGRLSRNYDLVLVEGHGRTPVQKIWLLDEGESEAPSGPEQILSTFTREQAKTDLVARWIEDWLQKQWLKTPVWGCVLIGGKSSRMGTPKHLIEHRGRTWIERCVSLLEDKVERVVISGSGRLPDSLQRLDRIPDTPGPAGPLAGILSVMRWSPSASWLVAACDMPQLQPETLDWLLSRRLPGTWAFMPSLPGSDRVEPLLAYYDFRCRTLLEKLAGSEAFGLKQLAGDSRVKIGIPPDFLVNSWKNINTRTELRHWLSEPQGRN